MGMQSLSAKRRDLACQEVWTWLWGEALRIQGNMSNQCSQEKSASTKGKPWLESGKKWSYQSIHGEVHGGRVLRYLIVSSKSMLKFNYNCDGMKTFKRQ